MTLSNILEAKKPTMGALKKELIKLGYPILSVKVENSSTGMAFTKGTPLKTIVITFDFNKSSKENNIYKFGDDNVYDLVQKLGITSSLKSAQHFKIRYDAK